MSFILGDDINWSLTAFATPDPDYRWFDPKGHLIDFDIPQTLTKYHLDVDSKTHRITLTIKHLQLYDMGHYILEILVNEGSSQVRHYSRVWNKRTPLNKRIPLENLAKKNNRSPIFTLYYEVRNKAVAPGKKSKI